MFKDTTVPTCKRIMPLTTKQKQRIENKKKKIAAFLEIARLNDTVDVQDIANLQKTEKECEPKRKRLRKGDDTSASKSKLKNNIKDADSPSQEQCDNVKDSGSVTNTSQEERLQDDPEADSKKEHTDIELEELSRQLREHRQFTRKIPRFRLKSVGESASISIEENDRIPLYVADIQHFLLASTLGPIAPYYPPRWCHLEKGSSISHVVILVIEGLSLYDFKSHESVFTNITKNFKNKVEIIPPSSYDGCLIQELAVVPVSGAQITELLQKYGSLETALKKNNDIQRVKMLGSMFPICDNSKTLEVTNSLDPLTEVPSDAFPRTLLLLSAIQLINENYPVPLKGQFSSRFAGYVLTKDEYKEVTPNSPMFALDCEMCLTKQNLELTRVAIVNEKLEVIYDRLVKPRNLIINYLTRYSGITEKMLANVTTRLEDVQKDIRELLPPDAILIGQSLNSDLNALKMMHPYVIDTSVIYNITGSRTSKSKLSVLASKFLGITIQQSTDGHCPTIDSKCAMKLTQLKLANDLEFGDAVLKEIRAFSERHIRQMFEESKKEDKNMTPTVVHDLTIDPEKDNRGIAISFFNHLHKAAVIGGKTVIKKYTKMFDKGERRLPTCVQPHVTSNDSVVLTACDVARRHDLVLAHTQVLKDDYMNPEILMEQVNSWCGSIWENTSLKGLCVVLFSGEKSGANGACFVQIKSSPLLRSKKC